MATVGWEGLIATDTNSAVAAPFPAGSSAAALPALATLSVALLEALAVPTGRFTDPLDE